MSSERLSSSEWWELSLIAESLGFCLQSNGSTYMLRRESDDELMANFLTAAQARELVSQLASNCPGEHPQ